MGHGQNRENVIRENIQFVKFYVVTAQKMPQQPQKLQSRPVLCRRVVAAVTYSVANMHLELKYAFLGSIFGVEGSHCDTQHRRHACHIV